MPVSRFQHVSNETPTNGSGPTLRARILVLVRLGHDRPPERLPASHQRRLSHVRALDRGEEKRQEALTLSWCLGFRAGGACSGSASESWRFVLVGTSTGCWTLRSEARSSGVIAFDAFGETVGAVEMLLLGTVDVDSSGVGSACALMMQMQSRVA